MQTHAHTQAELIAVTQAKISCDSHLSSLKRQYTQLCHSELTDKQISDARTSMTVAYNDIRIECNRHIKTLAGIKLELNQAKFSQQRDVTQQEIMYESLLEYFNMAKENAKGLYEKISDKITELETIRLTMGGKGQEATEEDSLINSYKATREATGMAQEVYRELTMQTSQLGKIRQKVGDFIGELNIGRTLIRMISNRSAEDYRLIIILTAFLILEILACYFFIRPWWKG